MPHHIVIIGAGFAGLYSALGAARLSALQEKPSIKVTMIAPEPALTIRPRLYESGAAQMSAPLDGLLKAAGVAFVRGLVKSISTDRREVQVQDAEGGDSFAVPYDRLILAAGSRLRYPDGVPGLKEHCFDVDQLESAARLEDHLRSLPGTAATAASPSDNGAHVVVVCGGGFTGIEVATALPARLAAILGGRRRASNFQVVLVDRNSTVGEPLGSGLRPVIAAALEAHGVLVKAGAGAAVASVDGRGVTLVSGERIDARTVIWTAGVAASDLTRCIPGERDGLGRLVVDEHLRVAAARDVFAAGDVACAVADSRRGDDGGGGGGGHVTLMSCQHAMPLGRIAGHNAAADMLNLPLRPYSQPLYVTCLDLGGYRAVVTTGWERKVVQSGFMAKMTKRFINSVLIYPPPASATQAFDFASPDFQTPSVDDGIWANVKFALKFWRRIIQSLF